MWTGFARAKTMRFPCPGLDGPLGLAAVEWMLAEGDGWADHLVCRGSPSGTTPCLPVNPQLTTLSRKVLRTRARPGQPRGGVDGEPATARYVVAPVGA